MQNSFLDQFSNNINFSYSCYDRMVIRGYLGIFFAGQMVSLLRAIGFRRISEAILKRMTQQLRQHVELYAEHLGIPIIWWPNVVKQMSGIPLAKNSNKSKKKRGNKKQRRLRKRRKKRNRQYDGNNGAKLRYVQKHFVNKRSTPCINHTYCIIADMENAKTFKAERNSHTKKHPYFYSEKVRFKHYYIYFHDKYLGLSRLKIGTYFPFDCEFYFNGHNILKVQMDKHGIAYKMKDNAFTYCSDPQWLQEIAQKLTGKVVEERIHYWMNRFFKFRKDSYSTRSKHLRHKWYLNQTEICSNVVFKSSRFGTNVFNRIVDKHIRTGKPNIMTMLFGKKRCHATESKTTLRSYRNNVVMKHWLGGNSIKVYNKFGYFIRVETTINRPKEVRLKKPVVYLQAYFWFGYKCNNKYQNTLADVDVNTITDNEPDTFCKPVEVEGGRRVAALDTRKERPVALMHELLNPKYTASGFTTKTLLHNLSSQFRNTTQIRYELDKLRARGLVQKHKGKSFYHVTEKGYKSIFVLISSASYFRNPLLTSVCRNRQNQKVLQPSELESGFNSIMKGLDQCVHALNMTS